MSYTDLIDKLGMGGIVVICILLILRELRPIILKKLNEDGSFNKEKIICPAYESDMNLKEKIIDAVNTQSKILERLERLQEAMSRDIVEVRSGLALLTKHMLDSLNKG